MRRTLSVLSFACALALPSLAFGQAHDHAEHAAVPGHAEAQVAAPAHGDDAHAMAPHGDAHGMVAAHGAEHGSAHGDDHVPTFDDFNWYYGLIAEKEGVEPSLLFRPKGMPVPFAALLLDFALLYFILFRALGKPVREGLKKRKEGILRGMEEAAKMKREAEAQLAFYEEKLAKIDQDVQQLRQEMRHAAETESARILSEAKERRVRMERDAHQLVEQELKAVREQLSAETIAAALASAEASLRTKLSAADQERFGEEYLSGLSKSAAALRGRL
jgi:F-type H+-transporting ATPase subunit b